jgi:hypothetical protein
MKTSRFIRQLMQFLTEIIVSIKQLPCPVIKKFLISIQKWIYGYVIHVLFIKKKFLKRPGGDPSQKISKIFLDGKIPIYTSVDAVFNGDHENHSYI